jgi:hypothetical protein
MKIELIDYLLQTSMTVNYNGNSIKIDNLVIDTGAKFRDRWRRILIPKTC